MKNMYPPIYLFISTMIAFSQIHGQVREDELVFAFRGHSRAEAERMVVVGEVVSIEKAELLESQPSPDLNLDTRPDNVVVKVLNSKGVRVGQTLYLVEKDHDHQKFRNGNIVGEIRVRSIFETTFFGKQLRGEGFTRLIENRPVTVVRKLESADTKEALVIKKKGDSYFYKGNIAQAMKEYRKSIGLDAKLPDAHFALGSLYKNDGTKGHIATLSEYSLAWKYRANFTDKHDRYTFYMDYLDTLRNFLDESNFTSSQYLKKLERMLEVVGDSEMNFGSRFETDVYYSWIYYHFYLNLPKEHGLKTKNYELAKEKIQKAEYKKKESLLFHQTAILVYQEELGDWTKGRPKTDIISGYMERIRNHGRRLLLINPPGNQIPVKVVEVLERID